MHDIIYKILYILTFTSSCYCKTYSNYSLYRGMPVNDEHLEYFRNLSKYRDVNFWRLPSTVYRPVEFVLPPERKTEFLEESRNMGIYLTTIITDLQSAFDKQIVTTYIRRNMASYNWKSFYRLKDIYSWLRDVSKRYPDEVRLFSIGKTYENRQIMVVKIVLKGSRRRSAVIIEGGIHAREWIAPAFVTYMIMEILRAPFSRNRELKKVALTYEWYFVPVLNPDGYEYSHNEDRLWRKNRHKSSGVDINRNFGYGFGSIGVSFNRDSDIYCGPTAFSERESKAMAELVKAKSKTLEYYIGFHSYGQFMIIPYAHSKRHVENYYDVRKMGLEAAKNISRKYGTKYTVGTAFDTVGYQTSGVSGCWVKNTYKIPYVLTFELRDNGEEGFALTTKKIIPTCQETMDGVISFLMPRTSSFKKLNLEVKVDDGQTLILDKVVFFTVVLLIIVMI